MTFTRRTHIVRISDAKKGEPPSDTYVDVEVLDAVSFIGPNGKQMVLNFDPKKIAPYIVDDTGGGNGKTPGRATRRSHMERITDKASGAFFDVEVLDCCAFSDENGKEWILNLPGKKADGYNTTDGDGGQTRRTHSEKVSPDFAKKPSQYLTVERTDMVAFRTINGEELVVRMASNDDPNSSKPRADTYIRTPKDYNPQDPDDTVKPPPNSDENVYVSFPTGGSPFTMDEKISQGMLWWIRKVAGGEVLVIMATVTEKNMASNIDDLNHANPKACKITSNYEHDADNGTAIMPPTVRQPGDEPLKFKEINQWDSKFGPVETTGSDGGDGPPPGAVTKYLFFLNVGRIKKSHEGRVEMKFEIPKLKQKPGDAGGPTYYVWVVSGGDDFTFVPLHPIPDESNAFSLYPFDDFGPNPGFPYIGLWNGGAASAQFKAGLIFYGIPVPPDPDLGARGFSTPGAAAAAAAAYTAFYEADRNRAVANAAANDLKLTFAPPLVYVSFGLDFPPAGAIHKPEVQVELTAWDFTGKTSFPYDEQNTPLFDPPKVAAKKVTTTFGAIAPHVATSRTVVLDKDGLRIE